MGALRKNLKAIRALLEPHVAILPVIKSEAYGHGLVQVAKALASEGVYGFGLSDLEEAVRLREEGLVLPLVLLSGFEPQWLTEIIRFRVIPVVTDLYQLQILSDFTKTKRKKLSLHLKIDTGMHRLGLARKELSEALEILLGHPYLNLTGVMSHLAAADQPYTELTVNQKKAFWTSIEEIKRLGFKPRFYHLANSAALILDSQTHYNLVRPGLALYGVYPCTEARKKLNLNPVMTLKARIFSIKEVPPGGFIGYGPLYRAPRSMKIAYVPIGYDDGYLRVLSNRGFAWLKGERIPVIGAVSMRCTAFDVSKVKNVSRGDEVILLGGQQAEVPVEDLAHKAGVISYELLCLLGSRAHKIYLRA